MDTVNPASLLGLPAEIRLQIYSYLLPDKKNQTYYIRSEDPRTFSSRDFLEPLQRSTYVIYGGLMSNQLQKTTYYLTNASKPSTSLLGVNRLISNETTHLLYGNATFDFGSNIDSIVPFLSDLRPSTLPLLRSFSLSKVGYAFTRHSDRCAWREACAFIRDKLSLQKITLTIVGGLMHSNHQEDVRGYSAKDLEVLAGVGYEGVEWMLEFERIRKLGALEIVSQVDPCAPRRMHKIPFFVTLSASIETGLREYLRGKMLLSVE